MLPNELSVIWNIKMKCERAPEAQRKICPIMLLSLSSVIFVQPLKLWVIVLKESHRFRITHSANGGNLELPPAFFYIFKLKVIINAHKQALDSGPRPNHPSTAADTRCDSARSRWWGGLKKKTKQKPVSPAKLIATSSGKTATLTHVAETKRYPCFGISFAPQNLCHMEINRAA